MITNWAISFGIAMDKKQKRAVLLNDPQWLETLERCRAGYALEVLTYEYWSYPSPVPEGSMWIKNNSAVVLFLSDGFLKGALETQVIALMERIDAHHFQEMRRIHRQRAFSLLIDQLKGESRNYRYWILSFFLYPLERFLKIAKM